VRKLSFLAHAVRFGMLVLLLAGAGLSRAAAEPLTIVAFGDSNTAGFRLFERHAYPAQLEALLRARGHDVRVVNSGVSGNTSAMGLARLTQAVPPDASIAIVYFGRNDLRLGIEPARLRANVGTIVKELRARNVEVLLIGMRTVSLADVAAENGALYYPDFFAGVSHDGDKDPQYTLAFDPIQHLNTAGYAVVAARLAPIIETMIAKRQTAETQKPSVTE
jgi:acyl-CoA thioesterase-1